MKFYAYAGTAPLGQEPCGTGGRIMFELKTEAGARRRCRRVYGAQAFRLYVYSNFFNDSTFREVSRV